MTETVQNALAAAAKFPLSAAPASAEPIGFGHINCTFLVTCADGRRYVLQRINDTVFRDVAGLMENIAAVTGYLRARTQDPRGVMHFLETESGALWLRSGGGCWRAYDYIDGTICLQAPESDEDFRQSAAAFGGFQQVLADFPARTLHETIPDFHNTPDRYRKFRDVLARDPMGRAKDAAPEIDAFLAREERAGELQRLRESGELPLRVTHNDTKLNNVLLDGKTRRALCVIDLDTVMPGLSLYDYGDAIRFGAATAAEDERDLSKMTLSTRLFGVFTRGYIRACPGLTPLEREMLPAGAWTMTMENGVRFLTDYLDGDHYFSTSRPGQNLDRCRTQLTLAEDMERKADELAAIVRREA